MSLEEQIKLEERGTAAGIARALAQAKQAVESDNHTIAARRLIKEFLEPVTESISVFCDKNTPANSALHKRARVLLSGLEPGVVAYITLSEMFRGFESPSWPLQRASKTIGSALEDEQLCAQFAEQHPDKYKQALLLKYLSNNQRRRQKVMRIFAKRGGVPQTWTHEDQVRVGAFLIELVCSVTKLAEVRKVQCQYCVLPMEETTRWMRNCHINTGMQHPVYFPCVHPPVPWTSYKEGGYHTPKLRYSTPLVRVRSPLQTKLLENDLGVVLDAVNTLQETKWRVNEPVLDMLKQCWTAGIPLGIPRATPYEFPASPVEDKTTLSAAEEEDLKAWKHEMVILHNLESERVSKCFQVSSAIRTAQEFKGRDLWFVYTCDFRGRMYCASNNLSPQGPDFGKALLKFGEGKVLGKRGAWWLMVHGANCYGKDKITLADRVKWVEDNSHAILAMAADPMNNRAFWEQADKPWQFLAFCYEYARYVKEGCSMLTYLPIGMDGSCNGLQNFSALLKDEVGAKATNLTAGELPADIYREVAAKCTELLQRRSDELGEVWKGYINTLHDGQLPRGLAKRPVMTLPYGSTQDSCKHYIYAFLLEEGSSFIPKEMRFKLAVYLTPIMWEAMRSVVVVALRAMDWIRHVAGELSKSNTPLVWWSPAGFPVVQARFKQRKSDVRLAGLGPKVRLVQYIDTTTLDGAKQRSGSAPNFVHSLDASHAMFTLVSAKAAGLTSFAFIHDDFGTHACDIDVLNRVLREQFVKMYTENSPLRELKATAETVYGTPVKAPPAEGRFNLEEVLDSTYFFA